jgi:release factor glutamine methyltransferase
MNIGQALSLAKKKLKDSNISSFNIDANLLLCHVLGKSKEFIIFNPEIDLSVQDFSQFEELVARRQKSEPISHILQKREFYNREFLVTKNVLDPRPDSESLIEYVLNYFPGDETLEMLEVGVGSGCLIITILSELKKSHAKAVDISAKAIEVANKNSSTHGVDNRLEIIESDLFSNLGEEKFDLIISNPPYIKSADIADLSDDVKNFEPLGALDGGEDGLDFYRQIAKQSQKYLNKDGSVILEIGMGQEKEIVEFFQESGFNFINSKKDLASIIRVLHFKI